MTWTDRRGKRMRTWMADEVGVIADAQEFMDTLVERAVGILEHEPIDIYVNPTYIPDQLAKDYDKLWTEARMQQVVDAAAKNHVAIELNDRYKLPRGGVREDGEGGGLQIQLRHEQYGAERFGAQRVRAEDDRRVQAGVAGFFRAGGVVAESDGAQGRSAEGVKGVTN